MRPNVSVFIRARFLRGTALHHRFFGSRQRLISSYRASADLLLLFWCGEREEKKSHERRKSLRHIQTFAPSPLFLLLSLLLFNPT